MALISFASWAGTWQLRQGDEGVMLWTQPHPPTSFQALRLEMRVNADPGALITVLRNTARHEEWLPQSREVRVLARSGPDDDLVYTRLASPWPVQDRELITRSHLSRRIDCGLTLEVWAEPNALPLHAGLFRIQESAGRWEALPQRDGSTLVRLETYTNPGNNLPGWLVNPILNAKGDSLRRRWEGNFAGASAPLVLNVLLDHLQRCSAARARKVRA
ncbi:START domain-containing protein [Aeromonas caviae]|uniref:START domain-containing protein n=3 Tax=Aeromonas caviae TaxID=648 RepID=UPI0037097BDB